MVLRRLLRKAEINRAVFFALLAKTWTTFSGPVSLVFISLFFTPELQGYYYTFLSLLALQTFLELSFSIAIVNFTSHEWSWLHLTEHREIGGDPKALSRLSHLLRFSMRWYAMLAVLFVIVVGTGGYLFLLQKHEPMITWQGPWCVMVVLVALQLSLLPMQATLDGCNQIAEMSFIRLAGAMAGSAAFWAGLYLRFGLWAACFSYACNWLTQVVLLHVKFGAFFHSLFRAKSHDRVSWREEILPVQWRLAVAGVVNYFSTSIFTPVMFWYFGAKIAGQMGMGWQIMGVVQAIALTWVQVKIPVFGALISKKEYQALDRLFYRITAISFVILLFLSGMAWLLVKTLFVVNHRFAERFMPPQPLLLFLLAAIFYHLPQCQSVYLRAHKREPLLVISVVSSLAIGGLVWQLGKSFGMMGAGWAYLGVVSLIIMPTLTYTWLKCRQEWHA